MRRRAASFDLPQEIKIYDLAVHLATFTLASHSFMRSMFVSNKGFPPQIILIPDYLSEEKRLGKMASLGRSLATVRLVGDNISQIQPTSYDNAASPQNQPANPKHHYD